MALSEAKIDVCEDQVLGRAGDNGNMRPPGASRLRITFAANLASGDVEEFFETGFGGFGEVSRGDDPRVLYLAPLYYPREIVFAQLDAFQKEGMLEWCEVA